MPVQLDARRGKGKLPLDFDGFRCPLFDKTQDLARQLCFRGNPPL
jgi:hypothetical protein